MPERRNYLILKIRSIETIGMGNVGLIARALVLKNNSNLDG